MFFSLFFREPLYFFDRKVQCTYLLSKVETCLYLVAIFEKRKENEGSIVKEFLLVANSLRMSKLLEQIKNGWTS